MLQARQSEDKIHGDAAKDVLIQVVAHTGTELLSARWGWVQGKRGRPVPSGLGRGHRPTGGNSTSAAVYRGPPGEDGGQEGCTQAAPRKQTPSEEDRKVHSGERKFPGRGEGSGWRSGGTRLTSAPLALSPGLGSLPGPCQLGPGCLLGSLQDPPPSLASFAPPPPPSLPADWTHLSGPFLPPVPPEQPFPGAPKPDTLLPGPRGPIGTRPFPGLPLLAGLGQGGGERLRLLSLRPQGLEVKPYPMMGAKRRPDPREGFSSDILRPQTGDKSLVSPRLENFKAVWPLDPP